MVSLDVAWSCFSPTTVNNPIGSRLIDLCCRLPLNDIGRPSDARNCNGWWSWLFADFSSPDILLEGFTSVMAPLQQLFASHVDLFCSRVAGEDRTEGFQSPVLPESICVTLFASSSPHSETMVCLSRGLNVCLFACLFVWKRFCPGMPYSFQKNLASQQGKQETIKGFGGGGRNRGRVAGSLGVSLLSSPANGGQASQNGRKRCWEQGQAVRWLETLGPWWL